MLDCSKRFEWSSSAEEMFRLEKVWRNRLTRKYVSDVVDDYEAWFGSQHVTLDIIMVISKEMTRQFNSFRDPVEADQP